MTDIVVAPPIQIRGRRVTLRPFREGEFEVLRDEFAADPTWAPNYGAPGAWERLRARTASSGMWGPTELLLAVEGDGRLAGDIQARHSHEIMPEGLFELGIGLFRGERGKGFGREAVALLTAHLFEREGAHRVQASTEVGNAPMRRLLASLGFCFEGVLRGFMPPPSDAGAEPQDYALYGITRRDHEERA